MAPIDFEIHNAQKLTCPGCGKPESTVNEAVLPLTSDDLVQDLDPHTYAVCQDCYDRQVQDKLNGKARMSIGAYRQVVKEQPTEPSQVQAQPETSTNAPT